RLFIADTNHHRIVVADWETFDVLQVIGSGQAGWRDGLAPGAAFHYPRGMALSADGRILYVADTGNHRIRSVDLESGFVGTIEGSGRPNFLAYPPRPGRALDVPMRSPWDLEIDGFTLYVA